MKFLIGLMTVIGFLFYCGFHPTERNFLFMFISMGVLFLAALIIALIDFFSKDRKKC